VPSGNEPQVQRSEVAGFGDAENPHRSLC
jgi:hypothetical protein